MLKMADKVTKNKSTKTKRILVIEIILKLAKFIIGFWIGHHQMYNST